MWGEAGETEHLPNIGPGATVVSNQSERETQNFTPVVRGVKYGW